MPGVVNRKGVGTARTALAFANKGAESVGESISRVRMAEVGVPAPTLQFEVYDQRGFWVARSDFCWLERHVVGEFDGQVKYTGTPEEVSRAVLAEKRREQAIRDAGWGVVRWEWQDLQDREAFRRRILGAFQSACFCGGEVDRVWRGTGRLMGSGAGRCGSSSGSVRARLAS